MTDQEEKRLDEWIRNTYGVITVTDFVRDQAKGSFKQHSKYRLSVNDGRDVKLDRKFNQHDNT
jgi:hypothetical protein